MQRNNLHRNRDVQILKNNSLSPKMLLPVLATSSGGSLLKNNSRHFYDDSKFLLHAFLATIWSAVTLLLTSTLAFAELGDIPGTKPTPFTAIYKVTKGIMSVGTTKRTLQHKGNGNYVFESVTKPGGIAKLFTSGKVIERSHWRMVDDKPVPQEYVYTNSSDQKRNVKVEFDWVNYRVTNTVNGDPWSMEIEDHTLDKLVYQLAIMYDLSQGESILLYQVADGGKTKTYDIKIEGEERIVTELGVFNTVKISRTNNDRTTVMWCAKELQYLPAKIEQTKNDDSPITAELVELSGIVVPKEAMPPKQQPIQ